MLFRSLGDYGWDNADKYVRFGLDYLWNKEGNSRYFSIVEIGTGRLGKRDGADAGAIRTAIATSWLHVDLFVFDSPTPVAIQSIAPKQLQAYRYWNHVSGEEQIAA